VNQRPAQAKVHVEHASFVVRDVNDRKPAAQQVKDARKRAHTRRHAAGKRINRARKGRSNYGNTPGVAVVFAGLLGLCVLFVGAIVGTAMFTEVFYDDSTSSETVITIVTPGGEGLAGIFNDVEMAIADARSDALSDMVPMVPIVPIVHQPSMAIDDLKLVDAKVLMVSMLAQPIEPEVFVMLQSGLDELRANGLMILGDLSSDIDDEFVIEQTAELANAIGSIPVDSAEFTLKIQEWISLKSFDGVLVLGTAPGQSDKHNAMLVMDEFHTSVHVSERTVRDLLSVLHSNGYTAD